MCGINGFNFNDPALIAKMNALIKHRGPDDDGFLSMSECSLGNTRLAILDLSPAGHQPMQNDEKTITLVFNGEIYNFAYVRRDLIKKGFAFKSNSDTEVIIKAYEAYGMGCLSLFNGIFSFALFDKRSETLFIVRDRLGIKPLYYFWDSKRLIFSSEIKALFAHAIPRIINEEAFSLYWRLLYVPAPHTMFAGIKKVEPGTYLVYKNNALETIRYWDPEPSTPLNFDESVEKVRTTITDAVRLQLISDRPVGVFLSGGVDSTIITGLVAKEKGSGVKTFSVAFDADPKKFNADDTLAKLTSNAFGTEHTSVLVTGQDCAANFKDVVRHMDEPVANATQVATYLLSKKAKEKVSVVLGGDGGDELFGGYERYRLSRTISRLQLIPRPLLKLILLPLKCGGESGKAVANKLLCPPGAKRYLAFMSQKESDIARILKPHYNNTNVTEAFITHTYLKKLWPDAEKQFMWTDVRSWLPDESLVRSDKMSMAFGVEERVPLLDHRLAELSLNIPTKFKIRGPANKYVLRTAFKDLMLPHLTGAPKRGWFSPSSLWLRTAMRPTMEAVLSPNFNPALKDRFNFAELSQMYQDHLSVNAYHMNILWAFMTFQVWYKEFFSEGV